MAPARSRAGLQAPHRALHFWVQRPLPTSAWAQGVGCGVQAPGLSLGLSRTSLTGGCRARATGCSFPSPSALQDPGLSMGWALLVPGLGLFSCWTCPNGCVAKPVGPTLVSAPRLYLL